MNKEDMMKMQRRMADVDGIDDNVSSNNDNYDEAPKKVKRSSSPKRHSLPTSSSKKAP